MAALSSLWLDTVERAQRPPLGGDVHADVCVVGAGITGLSAAFEFARAGAGVVVLEGRFIGAGATGYTTAKLSSLHGLTYAKLERTLGEDAARVYGQANQRGVERAFELAGEIGIDCDLRRKPNLTYCESPDERDRIEAEVAAARRAGLPAALVEAADLPFPIAAAVRFADQAEFHPVKFLHGLARGLEDAGARLHEGTFAVSVDAGAPCRVRTDGGRTVTAGSVVVATHLPFLDRGLYFARCHPERSYVVAAPYEGGAAGGGMYLSTESPAHSIRTHALGAHTWLLVGGESHKTGQGDARERYERLERWARERFAVEPVMRWATQDQMPADGVPYVGPVDPLSKNVYVATGFRKWGLAMGLAASELLAAWVDGRDHPWRDLYDTRRLRLRAGAGPLLKENMNVALRFFGDRVFKRADVDSIEPGEGRIVGVAGGQRAVYRDEQGELHALSARCTHLGCIVNWNSGEGTWDCPCHGSRFGPHGEVIMGPAVKGLARREPPG
ncbi:MAG: FAD-dependent oxidoreductase [Thermoleophilaceae bacterium]|nr:FAD-dependent oxidoreductase [Thermoleophilaceae bacterium]